MADFLLRDIDERVAERIKALAREKGWALNDVMLHLIKQALGMAEPEPPAIPGDIARLTGTWRDEETQALEEAMRAFSGLPDDLPSQALDPPSKPTVDRSTKKP